MLLRNTVYTLLLGSFSFSAMAEKACTNYDGYHFGNPSAEEQMHLELINRARANPKAEARLYGLSSVTEGVEDTSKMSTSAMQPLTFNYKLYKAAQGHSKDMADNEYFSHYSQGTNDSLFDRIKAQNYKYLTAGENLAYTATTGSIDKGESSIDLHSDLFIDDGYPGRGHRVNILNPKYKEVGVSLAFGIRKDRFNTYYVTDNFASYFDSRCHFITGVVYDDKDGDKFYSIGEGIKDVKITFENSDSTGKTYNAGGYGIPANDGTYQVTFTHTDLGSYTESITVNGQNIKVNVLASQFKSVSAGDTDPEPTTPEYAVSTYDSSTKALSIKALEFNGNLYDLETKEVDKTFSEFPSDQYSVLEVTAKKLATTTKVGVIPETGNKIKVYSLKITNADGTSSTSSTSLNYRVESDIIYIIFPEPAAKAQSTEYAVSIYDNDKQTLQIKAMAAEGFAYKLDVGATYAVNLDVATLETIRGKVTLITQTTGNAENMTVFKLASSTLVQSDKRGATYTLPSFVEVHEQHLVQDGNVIAKQEALYLYVEVDEQGYLVVFGTKPIS